MISYSNTNWVHMLYIPILILIHSNQGIKQTFAATKNMREDKKVFHQPMIPSRITTITDHETKSGYITSPNYPKPFEIDSSSVVHLVIKYDQTLDAIRLTFEDLNLECSNLCESESIQISIESQVSSVSKEDRRQQQQQQKQFKPRRAVFVTCGTIIPEPLLISENNLFIQLNSDNFNRGNNRGFKLKFEFLNTRLQLYDGCERANQYMCRNRQCIPNNLRCNKIDDCGDGSDEDLQALCSNLPTIPYSIDYECGLVKEKRDRQQEQQQVDLEQNNKIDVTSFENRQEKSTILTNRIVGGDVVKTITTNTNGLPFQVSIQLIKVEPISHICGGTLIHPMFILSASHCFKGSASISDYKFVFGLQDLRTRIVKGIVQVRYANSISSYPGNGIFNIDSDDLTVKFSDLTNDFVLIELNAPVVLNDDVWPACLPHLAEPIEAGRECFASGFGDTRGTGNTFKLKRAKQTILHSSQCHSSYSDFYVDDYTMICVKNQPVNGPCNGDSGGPLLCVDKELKKSEEGVDNVNRNVKPGEIVKYLPIVSDDDGDDESVGNHDNIDNHLDNSYIHERLRYTVVGVTSFTTDGNFGGGFCGLDQVPTIYARVSTKIEWLLSRMKMVMFNLNQDDNLQDFRNISSIFGYMFRSGLSRHPNFTRSMTIYPEPRIS